MVVVTIIQSTSHATECTSYIYFAPQTGRLLLLWQCSFRVMNASQPPATDSVPTSSPTSAPVSPDENGADTAPLVAQVRERIGRPVDRWAVVATLEAMGLRDTDARHRYGAPDLFALGDQLYPHLRTDASPSLSSQAPPQRWKSTLHTAWSYARGLLFVAPMALQIAAVLLLGYSLWAWLYFTETQATVVALGTLLSFIVTGGFVQSIGREGHLYLAQNNARLAHRACRRLLGLGMLAVGGVTLFFGVTNAIFPYYPFSLMGISALYFVLLSALWLSLSLLYVLDRLGTILGVTLLGIVPVVAIMTYTEWGIHAAHGLGLLLAVGLAYGLGMLDLHRRARQSSSTTNDTLPPLSIQIHSLRTYFAYGVCFFTFLSADRVIAWSVAMPEPPPYIIWFRTPYELGIDWALLSLLLTLAVLQHTVQTLSGWMFPKGRPMTTPVDRAAARVKRFHLRQLGIVLGVGVASIMGTYYGVQTLEESSLLQGTPLLMDSPVTARVFWAAAFGYLFLAVGLHNLMVPLILSRPGLSLRAFVYALGVNVAVGLVLSRGVQYEYAVFGLLAGGLTLAVLSFLWTRRFLDNFAYHYYAAY